MTNKRSEEPGEEHTDSITNGCSGIHNTITDQATNVPRSAC